MVNNAPAAMLSATIASNTNEASTIVIPPEAASPFLPYGLFRGKRVLRKVAEPSQGRQTQDLFSQ
jgi:hypothetical protein